MLVLSKIFLEISRGRVSTIRFVGPTSGTHDEIFIVGFFCEFFFPGKKLSVESCITDKNSHSRYFGV